MFKKIILLSLFSVSSFAEPVACHPTLALNDPNGLDEGAFVDIVKETIPSEQIGRENSALIAGDRNLKEEPDDINLRGAFRTTCTYSHFSFNDPIVYPGVKGAAHLHMFFGNTGVNHDSTAQSIEKYGNSTCAGGTLNRTAYWVPAFLDKTGGVIIPDDTRMYYKAFVPAEYRDRIDPFPKNLAMISRRKVFRCSAEKKIYQTIPDCLGSEKMTAFVIFPRCWDPDKGLGWDLRGEGHVEHVDVENCPTDHVYFPRLIFKFTFYKDPDESILGWHVASDSKQDLAQNKGGTSLHADWVNGWDPETMNTWIENCDRTLINCRLNNLGDGTKLAPYEPITQ